jgi:hypothetical protein
LSDLLNRGKQKADENGNNCNHNQEFNQRESAPLLGMTKPRHIILRLHEI